MCVYTFNILYIAVAVVGLEETFLSVGENVSTVELCAIIYMPNGTVNCPIAFPFNVNLSTSDVTAGKSDNIIICSY